MTWPADARELSLWPLRLFLGVTFSFAGLQKLANPAYLDPSSPTSVQRQILSLQHQSPIGWLLAISAHAPTLVGVVIAVGELAVGLATLLGLWVRLAALGGLLLSLTFFLTVSFYTAPYYYGSDIVFVFAWTVPLLAGMWPEPSLDGWIRARARADPDPQRRALLLGGASALGLAAAGGVAAGMTAAVGRALHRSTQTTSAAPRSSSPQPLPRPATASTSAAPGRHIATAAQVSPGHAVRFSDDNGDPAWLVHETSGDFRAFSAVCTHAGCTVDVSGGEFVCPCHGGTYDIATGAVTGGPPPRPLAPLQIRVVNGDVRLV